MKKMFENYPKKRTELSEDYSNLYKEHYKTNRDGDTKASGLAQNMEAWMHRKVASDVSKIHSRKTLEIGAGTLNQLKYEQSSRYDIIEPFGELFEGSPLLSNIHKIYTDIAEVDLAEKYDRIISIATFEHITDLPRVVARAAMLLDVNGTLRTGIPNEGTFLWKLGWQLTTGMEFKMKHGLDYGTLMKYEHVNNAREIDEVLNYFFRQNKCSTFGIGKRIALYRFYESKNPKVEVAREYLRSLDEKG